MDLPTHATFGFAIGLLFFGQPVAAFLVFIGAMSPDLDRDWFVNFTASPEEQRHRALFHNVFFMGLAFLASPFLAIGIFLHMLQDSFTTTKDRGCEWFYPLSRKVKRGLYDEDKQPQKPDPKEHVYFYQEDPTDDQTGKPAVPWRRVYGPALNSQVLDRMFLFGSIIAIGVLLTRIAVTDWSLLSNFAKIVPHLLLLFSVAILLGAGAKLGGENQSTLRRITKISLAVVGLALAIAWVVWYWTEVLANLESIASNWVPIVSGGLLIALASWAIVKWHERKYKNEAVV